MILPLSRPGFPICCAVLLAWAVGCGGPRALDEVPEHLLGSWKTQGTRYDNRMLEIGAAEIVVWVKGHELDRFEVEAIDVSSDGDTPVYRLHYTADEGYTDFMAIAYHARSPPTLWVGEIPFPWRRVAAP